MDSVLELGKVVLITGCSSGIGLETAIECAKEGHTVFATMRNLSKSSELEKRIKKENLEDINIIQLDVSDSSSIEDTIASVVRKTAKIDVLFNNAGFMTMGSLEDLTLSEIRDQINTDLMGPIHLTKLVLPHMKHGDEPGIVINMSSIAGKIGFGLSIPYCISKFGIEGFTESLRREMNAKDMGGIDRNVRVCLIEAGLVHTKFFENMERAESSYESDYAMETTNMEGMINHIKTLENWSSPTDVSKKVIEIINEGAEKCKYVVGDDAKYLIEQVHASNDNCKLVDEAMMEIMSQYAPQPG